VAPLFVSQIQKGGPITLTDENMTRFMMRIPQAAGLVLTASHLSRGGELFILKMPVIKIRDLAQVMIDVLAPRYGFKTKDIKITNIGKKNGEKIYELLMVDEESNRIFENKTMYCLTSRQMPGFKKSQAQYCRSDELDLLGYEELKSLVEDHFKDE
jgi:FlaA1/EpsC-like NDP-sugar epimerase